MSIYKSTVCDVEGMTTFNGLSSLVFKKESTVNRKPEMPSDMQYKGVTQGRRYEIICWSPKNKTIADSNYKITIKANGTRFKR